MACGSRKVDYCKTNEDGVDGEDKMKKERKQKQKLKTKKKMETRVDLAACDAK
ncbi:MAG TPA: hypothetical protein VHA52_00525 [Candidatus Babeliaceae bacterium]|nr:hypothetical protein [Candidatus Babeliaceae bacterium]